MVVAVGAIVFAPGTPQRVLLIQRGRPPRAGSWTIPGGHVETGETLAEAARREVREETGLDVRVLEETEVVQLTGESFAYAIHEHLCVPVDPDCPLRAGDDAAAARWAELHELQALGLSAEACEAITRASARLAAW